VVHAEAPVKPNLIMDCRVKPGNDVESNGDMRNRSRDACAPEFCFI